MHIADWRKSGRISAKCGIITCNQTKSIVISNRSKHSKTEQLPAVVMNY